MFVIISSSMEDSQQKKISEIEKLSEKIEQELATADRLLEKLIPQNVLQQLQSGKSAGAEEFSSVTVFFSDIANFTVLSSRNTPKDMIDSLNKLWVEYDAIASRYKMYKVETVGDAYLGVCGAPEYLANHAERAAGFSLDIIDMIKTFKTVKGESIQIRVGLSSGPVTGGIIGESNPHWCIIGEPVVYASKMESTSKIMQIHITESTYKLLVDGPFVIERADELTIKGKVVKSWYVLGRK
ncbi:nucleotide cyclase [Cladochytrium replicatum]|nr:nucleotide cyclase [Cladochytrium replicatum]